MAPLSELSGIIMITTQSTITAVNAGAVFCGNLKRKAIKPDTMKCQESMIWRRHTWQHWRFEEFSPCGQWWPCITMTLRSQSSKLLLLQRMLEFLPGEIEEDIKESNADNPCQQTNCDDDMMERQERRMYRSEMTRDRRRWLGCPARSTETGAT